jgi:hypothetical protein
MMETTDYSDGVLLAGGQDLAAALSDHGVLASSRRGLVYDASASAPESWEHLESELAEVFRLTHRAALAGMPIVYVVSEPAIWGHAAPLPSALATALLGGMRSAAVELARAKVPANAVAAGLYEDHDRVARSVAFLIDGAHTGQVLFCGDTHLGRPAA